MFHNFLVKLTTALLLIFAPLKTIAFTLGTLILIDFFTGVYKAYRNGDSIESRKMSHTVSKMLLYQVAIVSAFIAEAYILQGVPITKIVSGYIALTELKSISENVASITGVNFWKHIQEYLKRNPNIEEAKKSDETKKES